MKKRWRRAGCVVLAAALLIGLLPVPKAAAELDGVEAKSAILMSADTGAVLYDKNSHERRACGSVTKVMSLLLFMEALDSGQVSLGDEVTVSEFANSMGGSEIWLEVGEVMTFEDLLRSVVIQSANDSTVALAEYVAGSEEAFLNRMNERAAELGMNDTHYLNTTGFDEDGQYTSAYDIALAARELTKHAASRAGSFSGRCFSGGAFAKTGRSGRNRRGGRSRSASCGTGSLKTIFCPA